MSTNLKHLQNIPNRGIQNQTKFSAFDSKGERITYGNCLQTCIAMLLNLPVEEIPNVYAFYSKANPNLWLKVINDWLELVYSPAIYQMDNPPYLLRLDFIPYSDFTVANKKVIRDSWGLIRELNFLIPELGFIDYKNEIPIIMKGLSNRDKPHTVITVYDVELKIYKRAIDPHHSNEGIKLGNVIYFFWLQSNPNYQPKLV